MIRPERISFARRLAAYEPALTLPDDPVVEGRLIRMVGLTLEAEGCKAPVGSRCLVISETPQGPSQIEAEVIACRACSRAPVWCRQRAVASCPWVRPCLAG